MRLKDIYKLIRRNRLVIAVTIGMILTFIFGLWELDRRFSAAKKELIVDNNMVYLHPGISRFTKFIRPVHILNRIIKEQDLTKNMDQKALVEKEFKEIVADPAYVFYRFELHNINDEVIVMADNSEKIKQTSNWRNSLISRRYSNFWQNIFIEEQGKQNGRMIGYYTSPPPSPALDKILIKYWTLIVFWLLFHILIYTVMMRKIILPVRHVAFGLESEKRRIKRVRKPRAALERVYNEFAGKIQILNYHSALTEILEHEPSISEQEIIRKVPNLLCREFEFRQALVILPITGETSPDVITSNVKTSGNMPAELALVPELSDAVVNLSTGPIPGRFRDKFPRPDMLRAIEKTTGTTVFSIAPVITGNRLWGLIAAVPEYDNRQFKKYSDMSLAEAAVQTSYVLERINIRRSMIAEEQNKVGISIARNLGHDLTNIIASAKWDIDTISQLFKKIEPGLSLDDEDPQMFRDAVSGLLKNTEALQKLVDIYHAFGFLKKSQFEEVDINDIISDALDIFQRTSSKNFALNFKRLEHPFPAELEPRLIKLVIFNLISNSIQSVNKELDPAKKGEISIKIEESGKVDEFSILVEDNGLGIRNKMGEMLSEDKIDIIFSYGYSTRPEDEGGGIGLSWVRTIIEEFHGGHITASNLPGGGACIKMTLPVKHIENGNNKG